MSTAERYRAAGVDLDAADRAKARIKDALASARGDLARGAVGTFGGMLRVPAGIDSPVLVLSTDGVGTKVLVTARADRHDTVGEDLVNHCVNDILVHGARPLAFQDYIAAATLEPETIAQLVEGVARGCRAHGMTLSGGETAQMPELYAPGHYDLAGTIVGVVAEDAALHGDRVQVGDVLVGYASTGLHTNGYSLARRILFQQMGLAIDATLPECDGTVASVLLAVHRSYWSALAGLLDRVHALAHVTGGGIPGNLSRSLPPGCGARVNRSSWTPPPLFDVLASGGDVSRDEMYHVFNMGIGFIAVVGPDTVDDTRHAAGAAGIDTWVIGEVEAGEDVRMED